MKSKKQVCLYSHAVRVETAGVRTPGGNLPPEHPLRKVGDSELPDILIVPGFKVADAVGPHVLIAVLTIVVKPANVVTPCGDGFVALSGHEGVGANECQAATAEWEAEAESR